MKRAATRRKRQHPLLEALASADQTIKELTRLRGARIAETYAAEFGLTEPRSTKGKRTR